VKNIKGLVAVAISLLVGLLFVIALTGRGNKQPPTQLQKWNMEKLKKAEAGDFIICFIPGSGPYVGNAEKAMLVKQNDRAGTNLYVLSLNKWSTFDNEFRYNTFKDCEVRIEKNPENYKVLIGEVILNGLHNDNNKTEAAKPVAEGEKK
jgi:hypothetical protein